MLAQLQFPEHLAERLRVIQEADTGSPPEFVVYWMRTAVRLDENPALDVARTIANQFDVPLLIYQAISEHYRYASDRHHTFMLEGARDVQASAKQLGLSYALHVATSDDRQPHLVSVAEQAGVVVTEDMPVDPPRRFLHSLKRRSQAAIIAVDTACVVPMQRVGKAYTRAFQFRDATRKLYAERISRRWPELEASISGFDIARLPFSPVDLATDDIPSLVARCDIDHSVGPIVDTVGGSKHGYARWEQFSRSGLNSYARRRNNALLDGVSRMSPYLHYGMVSPFRIAREAADIDNPGAEKFLDELLIWRELAYAFCFYRPDHDQWEALPEWARNSLIQHVNDARPETYSWEELARGETVDALWDAAQKSLLLNGELHNNVRMTWGKAILNWTESPKAALQMLIDLNHRYALDGRDPASYGGILWCLGQFDRPFEPEQPIIGSVRPRPTAQHAKRLAPDEYLKKITRPRSQPLSVAVIGAGISGLFAARTLGDHGLHVTVYEKSRGRGGRMSTRRGEPGIQFDHGAQYFTVSDARFQRYVDAWKQQGLVDLWPKPLHERDKSTVEQRIVVLKDGTIESESNSRVRHVAVPTMNSICKHLACDLEVVTSTRIDRVAMENGTLCLYDDQHQERGKFDRVIAAIPAEQAAHVLREFPTLSRPISEIKMQKCWAAMISFPQPITEEWVGAFIHNSWLTWVARNSTKPGRDQTLENIVLHADPQWTAENWEAEPMDVANQMLDEFWRVSGCPRQTHLHLTAHRWGFALTDTPGSEGFYFDAESKIGVCGDWANRSRVEGAFLSGMAIAGRILGTRTPIDRDRPAPEKQLPLF